MSSSGRSVAIGTGRLKIDRLEVVEHGEVFTRRWVVDLILDLAGYTADRDLGAMFAIEPACGGGAFIVPMAGRLLASLKKYGRPLTASVSAIRGFDVSSKNVSTARQVLCAVLEDAGGGVESQSIAESWVTCGDYLTAAGLRAPDFVIGNPPYVRQENIAPKKLAEYRARYPTMVGRADIYIPFFEKALRSLKPSGSLAFICADRWMRNQYGRKLRALIGDEYSLDVAIEMHDVDAFDDQVSAYPAVTVIRRKTQGPSVFVQAKPKFSESDAAALGAWLAMREQPKSRRPKSTIRSNFSAVQLSHWFVGEDSWPTGSAERLRLVEKLNAKFDLLESRETGTRVGIGVATGADSVFVTQKPVEVEESRLLPLAMSRDTVSGSVNWSAHFLINPWEANGDLVDLADYPQLRNYFETNGAALLRRHVAAKRPHAWYRTIDKVDHRLVDQPKLFFPDMKLAAHPVLDNGGLYPHHNLYFVVSRDWDLEVLGGLLLSRVAQLFVDAYSVRMRGGTLRFQAQYLRRIRVPHPTAISDDQAQSLRIAFRERDVNAATATACRVYGIKNVPD